MFVHHRKLPNKILTYIYFVKLLPIDTRTYGDGFVGGRKFEECRFHLFRYAVRGRGILFVVGGTHLVGPIGIADSGDLSQIQCHWKIFLARTISSSYQYHVWRIWYHDTTAGLFSNLFAIASAHDIAIISVTGGYDWLRSTIYSIKLKKLFCNIWRMKCQNVRQQSTIAKCQLLSYVPRSAIQNLPARELSIRGVAQNNTTGTSISTAREE